MRYNWNEIAGDTPTAINPVPWLGASGLNGAAVQGEGIAAGVGYPTSGDPALDNVADPVFIVNDATETVEVANGNAASGANPIVNANFITGLNVGANIALSPNGQDLYVAQEGAGTVTEYNALTGAKLASVAVTNAHDVVVNAGGTVFVTAYAPGSSQTVGVIDFSSNLTNQTTFIAPNTGVEPLTHPTGLVFDASGNLWVANVYTVNGSVIGAGPSPVNFVSEYSSTGQYIRTIESNGNNLYTVFGLVLGPDDNVYAASFNGGEITEINTTTDTASTFLTLPSGDEPKYASWQSDAVTYVPVPEPKAYGMMTLGGVLLLVVLRRFKRTWRTKV